MVLENLGGSLRDTLRKIANAQHLDKTLVDLISKDIQRALLQSDVKVEDVFKLSEELRNRALTEKPLPGMSSKEHVIMIIDELLIQLLGPESRELELKGQKILLLGLYGMGKTTTAAKLAYYFQRRGLKPALVACDIHRPAAIEQLKQLGSSLNIPVYYEHESSAKTIAMNGIKALSNYHVLIFDSAGRHSLDKDLIDELKDLSDAVDPDEKLLVLDSGLGQQAGVQSSALHEAIGISGIILTKMDGTAKGGGALSAVGATNSPILFIGTGEHIGDLEKFDPNGFISRLLGMGDIKTLLDKAQTSVDMGRSRNVAERLTSGKFTLEDMRIQLEEVSKIGSVDKIMGFLPIKLAKDANIKETQSKLDKFKVIIDSMTREEIEEPNIIKGHRLTRIALGAGVEPKLVKELLHYYNNTKNLMKGGGRKMKRMLRTLNMGDLNA